MKLLYHKLLNREEKNESFLQDYKIKEEIKEIKKPKNMADVFESYNIGPNRSRDVQSNRSFESPDINYVYKPLK